MKPVAGSKPLLDLVGMGGRRAGQLDIGFRVHDLEGGETPSSLLPLHPSCRSMSALNADAGHGLSPQSAQTCFRSEGVSCQWVRMVESFMASDGGATAEAS